ncbi:MAG TPA: hypothetical protein VN838_31690 [Bradyrhizobium sp.]|nr:hypothetical protein [Bradyrhizobium sp.]
MAVLFIWLLLSLVVVNSSTVIARSPCDEAIQPCQPGAPGLWIASHIERRVAPPDGSQ